jgi:hypothetical protein
MKPGLTALCARRLERSRGGAFSPSASKRSEDYFMKLAAITLGLALAVSSTAAFAQGAGGSAGGGASTGASPGGVGTSGGVSSGTTGTTTGTGTGGATGATGGMNTTINPSGNTLLPSGQNPSQPATGPNNSTGR